MNNKSYLLEFYKWFIPKYYYLKIKILNSTLFKNEEILVRVFFIGVILAHFVGMYTVNSIVGNSILNSSLVFLFYLFLISVHAESFHLIENKVKVTLPDDLIIVSSSCKIRVEKIKNFGFTFSKAELKKIYTKLLDAEFIDNKTSLEDFSIVLMNDFGHKAKIYWSSSLTLAQLSKILDVFEQYSKSFKPSIAFRKKLFVDYKGDIIKITSYNNAKKSRNKKVEEYFFHEEYVSFVEFMTHFIHKND